MDTHEARQVRLNTLYIVSYKVQKALLQTQYVRFTPVSPLDDCAHIIHWDLRIKQPSASPQQNYRIYRN